MDARAAAAVAALGGDSLEVHYQPVVLLPDRHVVGFEALARLRRHTDRSSTLLSPESFIPVAERSGAIIDLGREVMREAVEQAARWRQEGTRLATATVSVNVSPAQLEQPGFVEEVDALLAWHGLPGAALVLEITESTAASDTLRPVIEQLSVLGVRISIDDFGTGFATLDTLRRIPAHQLKLDRSFVEDIAGDATNRAIVRLVADLAHNLGMSVVAEGVETQAHVDALLGLGCGVMQGYLFARPGPDPIAVASAVGLPSAPHEDSVPETREQWPVAVDRTLLAAARLLSAWDGPHRAAVHVVAVALARAAGLDARAVRLVGRLSLVHDLDRLLVDGALPEQLAADDRLAALARRSETSARVPEVVVVRAAVAAVDRASSYDALVGARALRHGLAEVAAAAPTDDLGTGRLLLQLATEPPTPVPFEELLEDLDRRITGRRGQEERMRSIVGLTLLGSRPEPRELLRLALEEARRTVGAASASLERWERDGNRLRCLVNVGQLAEGEETFPPEEVYPLADYTQARRTMLTGLPYLHRLGDRTADDEANRLLEELGKSSSAAVALHVDGRVWGQLWFATDHGEPAFETRDIESLTAVATLMSGVVAETERLQAAGRLAFEDPLTQVGNRRLVDDALARLSAGCEAAVVALLDIDGLGDLNETVGDSAGDAAIRQLADALVRAVADRPGATVGRLGGDEFCVVLPGCTTEEVERLLRSALARL